MKRDLPAYGVQGKRNSPLWGFSRKRERDFSLWGIEIGISRALGKKDFSLWPWNTEISFSEPLRERKRQTSPLEAFASGRGEREEKERERTLRPSDSLILKASGTHRP